MSPTSGNEVVTSSNQDDADNMKNEGDERWVSGEEDSPYVEVNVAYEDSFITSVKIQNTSNVDSFIIEVYDQDGELVSFCEK